MNYKEILLTKSKNERYINRYLSFILSCKTKNQDTKIDAVYTEKHHILPKSDFPEYKDTKENIIKLTGRQHFLAHWMLAKAISSRNMWFAFNQMRRINKNSILYEYARIEISKAISISNTGKNRSNEFKDMISDRFKGKQMAKFPNSDKYFWVEKDDARWHNGEIIPAAYGRIHSPDTKEKIGNANRGKSHYINKLNEVKMFFPDNVPEGFMPYKNPQWNEPTCENTIWCYNPKTGKQLRIYKTEEIPSGYIIGRNPKTHRGWEEINNKHTVLNVLTKKYLNINASDFDNKIHYNICGHRISNLMVMVHDNNVIIGFQNMLSYCEKNKLYLRREELKSRKIKNPHHNNTKEIHEFRTKHSGKNISDLGIFVTKFENFEMKSFYKLWGNEI